MASVVAELRKLGSQKTRNEMVSRYAIPSDHAFGVPMAKMQAIAKRLRGPDARRNHELALALWKARWYEARTVAALVDEPALVTAAQMDAWRRDFDSWAICDTVCFKLFDQTPHAVRKMGPWCRGREEFARRAGFALIACVALHNKSAPDAALLKTLPLIEEGARDERNFVKKAVSWALRSVGRRPSLKPAARDLAKRLSESADATARWVGRDALQGLK
ncbi:MAG: DNA alkylation repair protein [Phycisphaerales bacterium]|nr:DNA alkylation repair protein [Phycisphaerales bacterium]